MLADARTARSADGIDVDGASLGVLSGQRPRSGCPRCKADVNPSLGITFTTGLVLLLLVEGLLCLLGPRQTHLRVLSGHAALESAVEFGPKGKFLEHGCLLLVQNNPLLLESLVLHAVEALLDGLDLGGGRVGSPDGGGIGRGHAVGAEANGGMGLKRW